MICCSFNMFVIFLLIFAVILQNIDSSQVPICKGVNASFNINDFHTNVTYVKYWFSLNVATDENNATYPNTVTFSNYNAWSINNSFEFTGTVSFYPSDIAYNKDMNKTCLLANTPCAYNFPNLFTIMHTGLNFKNGGTETFDVKSIFFNEGTIITSYFGEFMDEQHPCFNSEYFNYNLNHYIYYTFCCIDFEYIYIPDSNEEICEVFETHSKLAVWDIYSSSFINFYFYGQSLPTKYGLNSYFNSNCSGFQVFINSPFYTCNPNLTCSQSFLYDSQFEIILRCSNFPNVEFSVTLGELILRNGRYFKNKNVPYTSADPCWVHNGTIPYGTYQYSYDSDNNGTYETSFCCVKFQSNDQQLTTSSITVSTSASNINSFTQVPVCKGVKVSYSLNDTNTHENCARFSFLLNVATDENNASYPNIVTFSNFNAWSINNTLGLNDTISFTSSAIPPFIYSVCTLNNTCTFHASDDLLYFNLYYLNTNKVLNSYTGYLNYGTILNRITGFFENKEENFCINNDYYQPYNAGKFLLCCIDFEYIKIPIADDEICQEFETKANFNEPFNGNSYLHAHSFITHYGLNSYIVWNISNSGDFEMPWIVYLYSAWCSYERDPGVGKSKSSDKDTNLFCSQPFPLGDFQYDFFPFLSPKLSNLKLGELSRRNGMYFKYNNIPYTSTDPCWTHNETIPGNPSYFDLTYETSFCCIKFGRNDNIPSGIPSLSTTELAVTSPISSLQPTKPTVISPSTSPQTTQITASPSFQPPIGAIGTSCSTDTSQAWLDIIFVIDTSSKIGKYNLKGLTGGLVTIMQSFNIAQYGDHTTRVGIITFATAVTVRYQLNDVTDFDDIESAFFKLASYVNPDDNGVNANDALQQAFENFGFQKSQRIPLIVLIAGGYDGNGFQNANQTSKKIKDNGISIITIDFGESDNTLNSELESIASSGYSYTFDQPELYSVLSYAFTQINCFCPKKTYQFRNYNSLWKNYTTFADCYYGFIENTDASIANFICDPGVLAAVCSPEKLDFITDTMIPYVLKGQKKFTIGLHKSTIDSAWKWWNYDKSEYPYDFSYPDMSQTPDPSDNYGYMWNYQGFKWKLQTGNNVVLPLVCQMKACDANYICDQSPFKKTI